MAKHLASLLKLWLGQTDSYDKNSEALVQILDKVKISPGDLLVILDIVSLFTMVSLEPTLTLLVPLFPVPVGNLFQYVLRSTHFLYQGQFYEQVDGVSVGSPLSPVIADF